MENSEEETLPNDRGGMVTARGTGDGLVIRLDGRVDPSDLREALADFISSRKAFIGGNQVALEWVEEMPDRAVVEGLSNFLVKEYSLSIKESRFKDIKRAGKEKIKGDNLLSSFTKDIPSDHSTNSPILSIRRLKGVADTGAVDRISRERKQIEQKRNVSLFDGIDVMNIPDDFSDAPAHYGLGESSGRERAKSVVNPLLWDDPDARIVNATLRSGQRVESDHSVIIRGDVNSGAEVIAGGDIIILGTLRGVAHAGAFDDTGGGRSITALSLQPTQLRIGSLISRGKSNAAANDSGMGIEVARIEGNIIVVEPYQVRPALKRN
jgi:septum formation inhibitor MinC